MSINQRKTQLTLMLSVALFFISMCSDLVLSEAHVTSAIEQSGEETRNAEPGQWPDLSSVDANAWVVYDRSTRQVILAMNEDRPFYPASTTKIMTAVLAMELLDLDQWIPVSEEAVKLPAGSSKSGLKTGDSLQVRHVLAALLIASGNDAANVLAEAIDGSIEAFAERMSARAGELGMQHTHFRNPSGLHDDEHVTTARDLAILTDYAMKFELFNELIRQDLYIMPTTSQHPFPDWGLLYNTNRFLFFGDSVFQSDYIRSYIGVKTGSTPYARTCLVSAAELIDGRELIVVLLGLKNNKTDEHTVFNVSRALLEESAKRVVDIKPTEQPEQTRQTETSGTTETSAATSTTTSTISSHPTSTTRDESSSTSDLSDPGTDSNSSNFIGFIEGNPWRAAFILLAGFLILLWVLGYVNSAERRKKRADEKKIQPKRVDFP